MKIEYNLTIDEILSSTGGRTVITGDGTNPLVFNEIITDSREDFSSNSIFIALKGKNFNGEDFVDAAFKKGASCAIVSWNFLEVCDISVYPRKIIIVVEDAVSALGSIAEIYLKRFDLKKKIAITGSCGKTTTKEMVYRILSAKYGKEKILKNNYNYNNLIGVPKAILNLNNKHEYIVLEIGTNKKGEIRKLSGIISPDVGAITNIGKSHLAEFKDIKGVLKEKLDLTLSLRDDSYLIINADDEALSEAYNKFSEMNRLSFGFGLKHHGAMPDILCESAEVNKKTGGTNLRLSFKGKEYSSNVGFQGIHLIYDLLCALLISYVCGVDLESGLKAMEDFILPEGRMKVISGISDEYILIDDTYNSSPDSLGAALDFVKTYYADKKKILVLGDMLELGDSSDIEHANIGREIAGYADYIFYKGDYIDSIRRGLSEAGFDDNKLYLFGDKEIFREEFQKLDKKNSVVLVKGSREMKLEECFEGEKIC